MSINAENLNTVIKKYPLLVISITLSLGLAFILYFRSGAIESIKTELESLNKEVKRYSSIIGNASQLQEQTDFLIKANQAIKDRTLSAESLAINLQYFYKLESEIGVKYLDLRPAGRSSNAVGSPYLTLNYIVTIQGSFDQILTYLKHIERGIYFARVNTTSITGSGSTVTASLNIDFLGSP
jgi:hypothetical protein